MIEHDIETEVLAELLRDLRPVIEHYDGGLVFKHFDTLTTGIPDVSVTSNLKTSWWEAKLGRPHVNMKGRGLQHLNMRRLALSGIAYYVIYVADNGERRTCLVEPRFLKIDGSFTRIVEEVKGWDHQFVVDFIKKVHRIL